MPAPQVPSTPNHQQRQGLPRQLTAAQHFLQTPRGPAGAANSPAAAFYTPQESFSPRRPTLSGSLANPLPSSFRNDGARPQLEQQQQHLQQQQQLYHTQSHGNHGQYTQQSLYSGSPPASVAYGPMSGSPKQERRGRKTPQQEEEEQQFMPSFLTDALLSTRRQPAGRSPKQSGSWSSTSTMDTLNRRRSVSRTPPASPKLGTSFGSPGREHHFPPPHSPRGSAHSRSPSRGSSRNHHGAGEDDLPPTMSMFAEEEGYFDMPPSASPTIGSGSSARRRVSISSDVESIADAGSRMSRSASPGLIGSPVSSSASSSAPDTPSPPTQNKVITVSGVDPTEIDALVDKLAGFGRIVAQKKGRTWVAARFADHVGVKAALALHNTHWRECILNVQAGDKMNALSAENNLLQHRAPAGSRVATGSSTAQAPSQTKPAPVARTAPMAIPGAMKKNNLTLEPVPAARNTRAPQQLDLAPPAHHLPPSHQQNADAGTANGSSGASSSAAPGGGSTSTKSSADGESSKKNENDSIGAKPISHKRPRDPDAVIDDEPPSRRTLSASSSPGGSNRKGWTGRGRAKANGGGDDETDDEQIVVKPAGFLATLSDWVFGW
ncbi:hypothetical protein HDU86_000675 [Geranomyces michiganensis]|nr:hypothetical protein HDU86_000675 [Geranomyces michiganensis]